MQRKIKNKNINKIKQDIRAEPQPRGPGFKCENKAA